MNLEQFKLDNPAYANTPNGELAYGLWSKFYKEKMPMGVFASTAGLEREDFGEMIAFAKQSGYEPTARTVSEDYVPEAGMSASFLQGQSFGWAGEALSAFNAAYDTLAGAFQGQDVDFGEAYENYNKRYDQIIEEYRAASPGMALSSEIGGALLSPAALFKLPGLLAQAGPAVKSMFTGGVAGSTYAAGTAESGERIEAAKDAFIPSALFGLGGQVVARTGVGALQAASRAANRKPTLDSLKRVKDEAYKAVDESGLMFGPDDMADLLVRSSKVVADLDYDPLANTAVAQVQRLLEKKAPLATSLGQLDKLRQKMWRISNGATPDDQMMIRQVIDEVDQLIDRGPRMPAGMPSQKIGDVMSAARRAHANFKKAELLSNAFEKAALETKSTGSGGNILNKYRQAVKKVLTSKDARFFSPAEIDMMKKFVEGTPSSNFLRWVGKLSPSGNGLMFALHAFGVAMNPATAAIAGTGVLAKTMSDSRTKRAAEDLIYSAGGLGAPAPAPYVPGVSPAAGLLSERF